MLESRKLINVKTLNDGSGNLFVRALINPSFGGDARPAVIMFCNGKPVKGHCRCAVGPSGVCCHILGLLLFLKHYWETGVKLLQLTCTEQLQKWHKKCRKGSVPMLPLAQLKVKAAKVRKAKKGVTPKIVVADPDRSSFKRNVPELIRNTAKRIRETPIPVMDHFYSVLSKSEIGRTSSFGEHICHIYSTNSLKHHDYAVSDIPPPLTFIAKPKIDNPLDISTCSLSTDVIVGQNELPVCITEVTHEMYATDDCVQLESEIRTKCLYNNSLVELDISNLKAPEPFGFYYTDCLQRSNEWHEVRKHKITGSRLPALLGFYGKNRFEEYWDVVKHGATEKSVYHIHNIRRGIEFEDEGVEYFEKVSKSYTEKVGFFGHPKNVNFGASPDALCASGLLLEVKTRAANCDGPLVSLKDYPNYFVQCQLEMSCTNAHSCVLLSYHPETKAGKFFMIQRDSLLMGIIMDVMNCIMNNEIFREWHHMEPKTLVKVGECLIHKNIDFETLKTFRAYIKSYCKQIPEVKFYDIDFGI